MRHLTPANAALIALIADRFDMSPDEALNFCIDLAGRNLCTPGPETHEPHQSYIYISRRTPRSYRAVCVCGFRSDTFDTYEPAARAANQHHTDMGAE